MLLKTPGIKLQSLEFNAGNTARHAKNLALLLQDAGNWKPKTFSLELSIPKWTDTVDVALADCVRNASCLKKLTIHIIPPGCYSKVESPLLLDAVMTGVRSLESFSCPGYPHFGKHTTKSWYSDMMHAVALNHGRRIFRGIFQDNVVVTSADLFKQLREISVSVLFDVLVSNEFDWQRKHPRETQNACPSETLLSRKRAARDMESSSE